MAKAPVTPFPATPSTTMAAARSRAFLWRMLRISASKTSRSDIPWDLPGACTYPARIFLPSPTIRDWILNPPISWTGERIRRRRHSYSESRRRFDHRSSHEREIQGGCSGPGHVTCQLRFTQRSYRFAYSGPDQHRPDVELRQGVGDIVLPDAFQYTQSPGRMEMGFGHSVPKRFHRGRHRFG